MDFLTDAKLRFLGRLKSNPVLDRLAAPHLWRPVGRPPKEGYEEVIELGWHQAASWKHPQRLLLVIVDRPDPKTGQLNLLPDYFFLVAGWKLDELDGPACWSITVSGARSRIAWANSTSHPAAPFARRLQANEALLRLSLLAFNLASMLRIEYEAAAGSCFDLGRFNARCSKPAGESQGSAPLTADASAW